ncbi:Cdc6-like AAA superfamily ATPase [Rhizobium binae]|uniref:Cdc6-like AAA superfamily ATPase n=1 Tax=Rhizobium binae TaxID=1138190 RepID=A0ABV2MGU6_9HYPH
MTVAVGLQKNVIISGGTGTGKTTMLNALSEAFADHELVIVIEDTSELQIRKEHVVYLEVTKPDRFDRAAPAFASCFALPCECGRTASSSASVQIARFKRTGRRRVIEISEIKGLNDDGQYIVESIYKLDGGGHSNSDGELRWTGAVPSFATEAFEELGAGLTELLSWMKPAATAHRPE